MRCFLNRDDANNEESCVVMPEDVDEVLEMMRVEVEPPIDDGIQLIETFAESKSATDFKGFEARHNNVLDIDDQLLCSDAQTKATHMYDELQRSFETFQRNINKLTLNVKLKKFVHSQQMTCMTCSNNMNPDFCQKNCALNRDAYLIGRLM